MKTTTLLLSMLALVFAVPAPKAEDNFTLVKVADGVYAAIAKPGGLASGNAGFVAGDNGVLMVDTFFTPAAVEDLIGAIAAETNQPLKYALNTHYHLDHTGGNQVLVARGIPISAHEKEMDWQTVKNRRFLPAADELQKRRDTAAKQMSDITADQADKRAPLERQIRRLDAMLSIKLTNLVDATVTDWIASLDKLLAEYPTAKFVSGHGEVATAAEMREFRDYLVDLKARMTQAIAQGLTIEQAKEQLKLPEKYKEFAFQNFAVPNVEDMYKELKGTKFSGERP